MIFDGSGLGGQTWCALLRLFHQLGKSISDDLLLFWRSTSTGPEFGSAARGPLLMNLKPWAFKSNVDVGRFGVDEG